MKKTAKISSEGVLTFQDIYGNGWMLHYDSKNKCNLCGDSEGISLFMNTTPKNEEKAVGSSASICTKCLAKLESDFKEFAQQEEAKA